MKCLLDDETNGYLQRHLWFSKGWKSSYFSASHQSFLITEINKGLTNFQYLIWYLNGAV